tara:strand:+ start:327 stop:1742 length:1416 start_codon:yes stop_codon:yes gene_type:complete
MLEKLVCKVDAMLIDAWKIINENGKGIVFIIDDAHIIYGVLTDGDIRAYLLKERNFNVSVSNIMNRDFVFSYHNYKSEDIIKLFNEKIKIIPIIDDHNKLIDYMELNKTLRIPVALPDLKGKEFEYLTDAFLSTWISSSGKYIDMFEKKFASFCDTNYGIAVSNGTVALQLALETLGIGEGDEVIVPDLTFAATINAVLHVNATPVIVDIEEDSWCIDPKEIEKAITPNTKAVIPVHIYGQVCDMNSIMQIAKKNKLYVIEDCAEAHGASYNEKKVGSIGDIGCFSFFANKVITTGEGGMCTTNNKDLDNMMRLLRDHGMNKEKRYWHDLVGYNFRMTNLQASIGVAQIERIEQILLDRKSIEDSYKKELRQLKELVFQPNNLPNRNKVTWFVSMLLLKNRDLVIDKLKFEGIDARPFFYPLSIMPIYKPYVFSSQKSQEIAKLGINLPTNNMINKSIILRIKAIIENNIN